MFCCWTFPPYSSKTWHYIATVRHTDNSDSSHNMPFWIVTVCYNSATYCYIVRDSMFCRWMYPPHCSSTWHTVATGRDTINSGSFNNMPCWIVTVCSNSATYCFIVRASMLVVGFSRHTVQISDIMLQMWAILVVLAGFIACCFILWQCVAIVQRTVGLFVTACFVVGFSRHYGL
jgi:hypothetical protein